MRVSALFLAVVLGTFPLVRGDEKASFLDEELTVKSVYSAAVELQWPTEQEASEAKLTCIGAPEASGHGGGGSEVGPTDIHKVVQYAPEGVQRLMIGGLRPSYKYMCVRMMRVGLKSWGDMSLPAVFTTHATDHKDLKDMLGAETIPDAQLTGTLKEDEAPTEMGFKASYRHKMTCIILGGLLPMVLVVGCIATCILYKKCNTYRIRRERYNQIKEQKISPAAFPGAMVFERNLHKQANRKMYDCGKDWMKDMEAGRMKGAYPSGMPLKQYPLVDSEAITTEDGSDDSELERVVFNNLPYFHEDFDQDLRFMYDGRDPWLDGPLESECSQQPSAECSSDGVGEGDTASESDGTEPLYQQEEGSPLSSDDSEEMLSNILLASRRVFGMGGGIGAQYSTSGIPGPLSMVVVVVKQQVPLSSPLGQKQHSDDTFTRLN